MAIAMATFTVSIVSSWAQTVGNVGTGATGVGAVRTAPGSVQTGIGTNTANTISGQTAPGVSPSINPPSGLSTTPTTTGVNPVPTVSPVPALVPNRNPTTVGGIIR